uniref:C-type lectin domain-containing protein n=1 Tax=Sinocyclocheilus grahami TaxID=75366 RepID=A0A672PA45_SINGR
SRRFSIIQFVHILYDQTYTLLQLILCGTSNVQACFSVLTTNLLLTDYNILQYKFRYFEWNMNWHGAQRYCRSSYVDLATVTDDTENTYLANVIIRQYDNEGWIGLSKNLGLWQWSDQTSVSSSVQWDSGQPDNMNSTEDCVSADTDGQMADDTCSTRLPFYCRENTKIQRVRFAVKSDGSLDESTVMEAIEKKVR